MGDFQGRTIIVTGGTGGIGGAVTRAFLLAGAAVTAIYGGNNDKARKFSETAPNAANLNTVQLDVADDAGVENFFKEFAQKHGKLDVLVNCAGVRKDAVAGMMKAEDWRRVIDVNLTGTFNMSKQAVLLMMRKRYGRIISITSPAGKFGFAGQGNYSASKAGQTAFSLSLAKETAGRNITVNCVSPGFVETDFIADLPEKMREAYRNSVPMKRFGAPEEIAPAVIFLASEQASYITGAVLEVSGGL